MVLLSMLRKRLAARHGGWASALIAIAFYLVAMILVGSLLPAIDEVPEAFPIVVLRHFRVASFGKQLVMWTTPGLVFGTVTERAWARHRIEGHQAPTGMTA